jgi:hypothetical protein
MNQQFVGNAPDLLLKRTDRTFQVDCVPEDDCGHYQIESAGVIPLKNVNSRLRVFRWMTYQMSIHGLRTGAPIEGPHQICRMVRGRHAAIYPYSR